MYEGTITRIIVDRGFGFIASPGLVDTFFHAQVLADMEFDEQLLERRVRFTVERGPKGPRAVDVIPADD